MHCAERGELLDRVRRWYELELNRLNEMLERSRERIRKLQEMARKGDPLTMAELDSNIAKSSQVPDSTPCLYRTGNSSLLKSH